MKSILFIILALLSGSITAQLNQVKFIQGDSVIVVTESSAKVVLNREAFSFHFFTIPTDEQTSTAYPAKVAVTENAMDTALSSIGKQIQAIDYFANGSSYAMIVDIGYPEMVIASDGNHYLEYSPGSFESVNFYSAEGDYLELEWHINNVLYKKETLSFAALPLKLVYMIVLQDFNINNIIDDGELKIITIHLND
jgi:hypothetical protein